MYSPGGVEYEKRNNSIVQKAGARLRDAEHGVKLPLKVNSSETLSKRLNGLMRT